MNKYARIWLDDGLSQYEAQIALKDIVACYVDSSDDIVIEYSNGSQVKIVGGPGEPLNQADVDIVFGIITQSQEDEWTKTLYNIPTLSQSLIQLNFTF
jgi:hypothetical protein